MATVYQTNPQTGVKYAYSTESYWDKEAKRPRNKREYLGRVDPETGEIIPKKSGGRKLPGEKKGDAPLAEELQALLAKKDQKLARKDQEIATLQEQLAALQKKYDIAADTLRGIWKTISSSGLLE